MITAWHDLLGNLGIVALFAAALAYGFDWIRQRPPWQQTAIVGVSAGGCACALLLMPITILPGVIYDLRAVPVALAGFLWNPPAAVIAGVIAALCRVYIGGIGAAPAVFGLLIVVITSIVGWMVLRGRMPDARAIMALFGIATAAASMSGWLCDAAGDLACSAAEDRRARRDVDLRRRGRRRHRDGRRATATCDRLGEQGVPRGD